MVSPRVPAFLPILALVSLLFAVGCGSDEAERYESETTRAIREKVRADLEEERLERIGKRFAEMNENLASSANAFQLTVVEASEEEAAVPASLEEGETLYAANCASCHGAAGGGDGPLGATLNPPPTKHNDGGYMNALTNDHLYKVVDLGGAAVGKSALMAPWGTSLSENQINGLVGFMRTLAQPAYDGPMPEGL